MALFLPLNEQTALIAFHTKLTNRRENKRFSKSEAKMAVNKRLNHTTTENIRFVFKTGCFQPAKFLSVPIFRLANLMSSEYLC